MTHPIGSRNPYLLLGIPYGAERDTAARAYARALRRVRSNDESPVTLEDLNWALHEVEHEVKAPHAHAGYLRVPALPHAYEFPRADAVLTPRTPPLQRTTAAADPSSHLPRAVQLAIRDAHAALTGLAPHLAPRIAVPAPPAPSVHANTLREQPSSRPADPRMSAPDMGLMLPLAGSREERVMATMGVRIAARLADLVLVGFVVALFLGESPMLWQSMTWLLFFGYSVGLESHSGQTLGKRIFGIQVASLSGSVTLEQAAKRNSLFLFGVVPFVGWILTLVAASWAVITAVSRADSQGFHDDLGGIVVVVSP